MMPAGAVRRWCMAWVFGWLGLLSAPAQTYESLWKKVENYRVQSLPKSALKVVETSIESKARREGNRGQELAALLTACALRQEVVPDSFFTDILHLERRKAAAKQPAERAMLASVLGELYGQNRRRSQASGHAMAAHPDSLREWAVEQYDSASRANYHLSMADPEALLRVRARDWAPFVAAGRDASYFKGDLLNVVGRRAMNGLLAYRTDSREAVAEVGRVAGRLLAAYRKVGNREAELFLLLDSVELSARNDVTPLLWERSNDEGAREARTLQSSTYKAYDAMRRAFADLPVVTEVYIRLVRLDVSARQKMQWAEEGRSLYPAYGRTAELVNEMNRLQQPEFGWLQHEVYYPGQTNQWILQGRNIQLLNVQLYRMRPSFNEQQMNRTTDAQAYVKQHGVPVDKWAHTFSSHPAYENFADTVAWKSPEPGLYVVVFTPTAPGGAWKKPRPLCRTLHVSALRFVSQSWLDGSIRGCVVDDESGRPVPGATVKVYRGGARALYRQLLTDSIGGVTIPLPQKPVGAMTVQVSTSADKHLPEVWVYGSPYVQPGEPVREQIRLYTDRAIYRPGQEVQLGGVVFTQKGRASQVVVDKELEVVWLDANGKDLAKQTVKTDEMGTLATSFSLPAGGLPGLYHVRVGDAMESFRVEEYKRPTYQVTFVPFTDRYAAGDTIHVRGEARTFSGVPVRNARITGLWRWVYPYRWGAPSQSPSVPLDTLYADAEGTFSVALPLQADADDLRRGCRLQLSVEVFSPAGETQTATYSLPVSTTPLRLQATVPEMQDRERLRPWMFRLLSPNESPVEGRVSYALYPWGGTDAPVLSGTVDAQRPLEPEGLGALASGRYRLQASAQVEGDTASWSGSLLLFGTADTRVPVDTAAWFYCPSDTFSAQRPATICVGSGRQDVSLYYTLTSGSEVLEHRLITFSDSILTFTYPYKEGYGDGLSASFLFVKGGKAYAFEQQLKREVPNNHLSWRWTSFRDKLTPGAQEEWSLELRTPDGKPASARLMAALYDASLDPLAPHVWRRPEGGWHPYLPMLGWRGTGDTRQGGIRQSTFYSIVWKQVPELQFDAFDEQFMPPAPLFGRIGGMMHLRGTKAMYAAGAQAKNEGIPAVVELTIVDNAADVVCESVTVTEDSAEAAEAESGTALALQPAVPALRTNFNETAFFYPRLHTDEAGAVSIRFTLPESLTTWNFLGVAYTADMQTAELAAQATASKDFMARLMLPRFLRQGDASVLNVTLDNLSTEVQEGVLRLELFDPETQMVIYKVEEDFCVEPGRSAVWACTDFVPSGTPSLLACRVTAECGDHTDGEQAYLPVLSAEEWVTETVALRVDSVGQTKIDLSHLFADDSPEARRRTLTVEYTANPLWNAVLALPALEEPQSEDVLSLAAAYYAGTLAAHIARENSALQPVIETWKRSAPADKTLWSDLQQNEALAGMLLSETPWVRDAEREADRRARLITLFDVNGQTARADAVLARLQKLQGEDGSFGWYPGMRGSEYLTQEVAELLVRLRVLAGETPSAGWADRIFDGALNYLKAQNRRRVEEMRKLEARGMKIGFPGTDALHYLYIALRSGARLTDVEQHDNRYLLRHIENHIGETDREQRALAAIVLQLAGKTDAARRFMASLKENLSHTAAQGAYFEYPSGSFSSIDRKLSIHVLAMEALDEVLPAERQLKAEMRRWLLQQKRVQSWSTPVNSASAVYALLKDNGKTLCAPSSDELQVTFRDGARHRNWMMPVTEKDAGTPATAGLGYVQRTFAGGDMPGQPLTLTIDKPAAGESWGAVYAQYRAPLSDVQAQTTGLRVRRELSATRPKPGDKLVQRYVITADRDYEFVRLKAGSAACMEPGTARSGYGFSDGLGYYKVVRDASTEYFFDRLPKGTYVLEHTTYVDRAGTYSAGLATLECLYAPEYRSHTEEVKVYVEP